MSRLTHSMVEEERNILNKSAVLVTYKLGSVLKASQSQAHGVVGTLILTSSSVRNDFNFGIIRSMSWDHDD